MNFGQVFLSDLIHSLRKWATLFNEQISKKYEKTTINEAKKLRELFLKLIKMKNTSTSRK